MTTQNQNQNQNQKQNQKEEKKEEIWIKRNKANFVTIGFDGMSSIKIFPGLNRVTDKNVIKLIKDKRYNKGWEAFIENGTHTLVDGKKKENKKGKTTVFTSMEIQSALELVEGTFSIPALEQMMADEQSSQSRDTVMSAIKQQIEKIKDPNYTGEDGN